MPRECKKVIYKTILRPILTHGLNILRYIWKTRSMLLKRQYSSWSKVSHAERRRNDVIIAELGVKGMLLYVETMQLKWYGHVRGWSTVPHALLNRKSITARLPGCHRMDNVSVAVGSRGSTQWLQRIRCILFFCLSRLWSLSFWKPVSVYVFIRPI